MGNCQATAHATLVIQHPNAKESRLLKPIVATEIMKINPGHYVALLLTTTLYPSTSAAAGNKSSTKNNNTPLRVTRTKLLRPTDTLVLGHVYRLVSTEGVMKGLGTKKLAKLKQQQSGDAEIYGRSAVKPNSDFDGVIRRNDVEMTKQVKDGGHKSRNKKAPIVSAASKSKAWQPSLSSISEEAEYCPILPKNIYNLDKLTGSKSTIWTRNLFSMYQRIVSKFYFTSN